MLLRNLDEVHIGSLHSVKMIMEHQLQSLGEIKIRNTLNVNKSFTSLADCYSKLKNDLHSWRIRLLLYVIKFENLTTALE